MRRLLIVAALGVFTACSGGSHPLPVAGSMPATERAPRGWPAAAKKPILFVADLQNNVVHLYDPNTPNAQPEGSITDGVEAPSGLAVDAKGNLYVNNIGNSQGGDIAIYAPGKSKPRTTIKTTGYYGIAVDSKGDIFATSVAGSVYGYKPGAKKPFETIGGFTNPVGIAIDSKNNIGLRTTPPARSTRFPPVPRPSKMRSLPASTAPTVSVWNGRHALRRQLRKHDVRDDLSRRVEKTVREDHRRSGGTDAQRHHRFRHLLPIESNHQCGRLQKRLEDAVLDHYRQRRSRWDRFLAVSQEIAGSTVVVGAGAAGLAAARHLARASRRVVVLEARDRIGGRVLPYAAGDGSWAELGAEFIHGNATLTYDLLREAALGWDDAEGERWNVAADGALQRSDDSFAADPSLFDALREMPRDVSVDEFFRRFAGDPAMAPRVETARAFIEGFDAADPSVASARGIAAEWRSGVDERIARPRETYRQLFDYLYETALAAGAEFHFGTAVARIIYNGDDVLVEARDANGTQRTIRARACIVTLPTGVLRAAGDAETLTFEPALPLEKQTALQTIEAGDAVRVVLWFRSRFWERIDGGRYRNAAFFQARAARSRPIGVRCHVATTPWSRGVAVRTRHGCATLAKRRALTWPCADSARSSATKRSRARSLPKAQHTIGTQIRSRAGHTVIWQSAAATLAKFWRHHSRRGSSSREKRRRSTERAER